MENKQGSNSFKELMLAIGVIIVISFIFGYSTMKEDSARSFLSRFGFSVVFLSLILFSYLKNLINRM